MILLFNGVDFSLKKEIKFRCFYASFSYKFKSQVFCNLRRSVGFDNLDVLSFCLFLRHTLNKKILKPSRLPFNLFQDSHLAFSFMANMPGFANYYFIYMALRMLMSPTVAYLKYP
jgi:hypothetical protein